MKLSILVCAISVIMVTASPGASSLKRGFKEVMIPSENGGPVQIACIECPCDGWTGSCECVPDGCCCSWPQPTITGWVGA
ncbi:hypothetical protein DE146DRAFT_756681 [Phaeosphaeria sp. MPI-PUGE-AT-0046c]|nr:hypothetical protein DE146DRAFT_756681 [Phaeosphaeria sp. MPI-PUGE-AT-0046c]